MSITIVSCKGSISYEYGIQDFVWDCGWETVHRRGVVEAFLALVVQYPEVRETKTF